MSRQAVVLVAIVVLAAACGYEPSKHVSFATIDAGPAWSRDGRLIAFASSRSGGGVYVVRPDGRGLHRLVRGPSSDPVWSPDGRWLAYSGEQGVYLVRRGGGRPVRILRGPFSLPAWAPGGHRLAVMEKDRSFVTSIDVVGRDGPGLRRLVAPYPTRSASESEPCWSPSGREVVFEAGDGELAAVRVADGRVRKVVRMQASEPAWSPDGRLIAFQSAERLWVANADGSGNPREFEIDADAAEAVAASGGHPAWSPDSRRIVFEVKHDRARYTRRASSLSVIDLASGEVRKVTYDGSAWDDPTWRDGIVGKSTW